MNIKEAKKEIIRTVQAYLDKDETGAYTIPRERQRPILLMGPPGIGKTAIMEQVAEECEIGLVSYTITHHTRQSAIGLPFISKKIYGGREYSVTEYTMSEIIASVYDQIEASGVQEGILFLDEINCVSETLAPTMLQFLQYKTFGTHRIPDGFLIVTAGNPPQYNKSVRDFDIVTLDRIRRIDIEEDFGVFREYASRIGLHGSIMAYLAIRSQHFYSIRTEVEGRYFVTARGWEDLSRTIQVYEKKGLPVGEILAVQFLQDPEIARSFAAYYDLYRKYEEIYRIPDILEGRFVVETFGNSEEHAAFKNGGSAAMGPDADQANADMSGSGDRSGGEILYLDHSRIREIKEAPFDEKLSLISLLIDALSRGFADCAGEKAIQQILLGELNAVRVLLRSGDVGKKDAAANIVQERCTARRRALQKRKEAGLPVSREEEQTDRAACMALDALEKYLRTEALAGTGPTERKYEDTAPAGQDDPARQYACIRRWFSIREQKRQEHIRRAGEQLTNTFRFLSQTYGEGQEMVLFLTELTAGHHSMQFISEHGNDDYFRYNRMLLLKDRRDTLREEVLRLME